MNDKSELNFRIDKITDKFTPVHTVHQGKFYEDDTFTEENEENMVVAHKNAFIQVDNCIVYVDIDRSNNE